jgi:hypothetical protein
VPIVTHHGHSHLVLCGLWPSSLQWEADGNAAASSHLRNHFHDGWFYSFMRRSANSPQNIDVGKSPE